MTVTLSLPPVRIPDAPFTLGATWLGWFVMQLPKEGK